MQGSIDCFVISSYWRIEKNGKANGDHIHILCIHGTVDRFIEVKNRFCHQQDRHTSSPHFNELEHLQHQRVSPFCRYPANPFDIFPSFKFTEALGNCAILSANEKSPFNRLSFASSATLGCERDSLERVQLY